MSKPKTTTTATKFTLPPVHIRANDFNSETCVHRMNRTPHKREDRIVAAYQGGESVTSIIKKFHVSPGWLKRVLGLDPVRDKVVIDEACKAFADIQNIFADRHHVG